MLDYEALLKNNKSAKFYWIYKHFNILKQYCVLYIYLLENIHVFNIWIFSSKFLDEISILVLKMLIEKFFTGLLQTDDRIALTEITRQLKLENTLGDKVFVGNFLFNHKILICNKILCVQMI